MSCQDVCPLRGWKGVCCLTLQEAGVTVDDRGVVTIPIRTQDGSVFRNRYFAPDGRCWWGAGNGLIPLGLELLPTDPEVARHTAIIITEGESDMLAARECFAYVAPGGPIREYRSVGLPGAATWRPSWRKYFDKHGVIYLCGDADAAGRQMIDAVHRDLPWSRPVWLPEGRDVRDVLQNDGPRALDPLLDHADEVARLCVAFMIATSYDEFVNLMSGRAAHRVAA